MNIGLLRIKFIWGGGKVIQARWRFGVCGFYEHAKGYHNSGLVFSVRGLLVLGLILLTLAYVGGTTALYLWLDRSGHNYVTYTDTLLWPLRREVIREKRGQAYIDEGIADLRAQRWNEGVMKLQVGLMRLPTATRARLALAEFYTLSQRPAKAIDILAEGLAASPEYPGRRYLNTYIGLALQAEDYERVRAAVDLYLEGGAEIPAKERNWLLQQKLMVLMAHKQAAEVLALIEGRPADVFFNEQRTVALLMLNRPEEAVAFLGQWRTTAGPTAQILRLQVRAFREAGQLEAMETALGELRRLAPTDPTSFAYGIVQRAMAGRRTAAETGLDDYFLRFGANARSMLPLAPPLAEIGAVDLLEEFITRLGEQGHDRRPALMFLAQAQLKNGDWEAAAAAVTRIRTLNAGTTVAAPAGLELIELLAQVAGNPAEGPQVQLLDHINRQMYPLKSYRTIIETLLRAGRNQVAHEVAVRAERLYPGSTALLALKGEVQAALAAEAARVAQVKAPDTGDGSNSVLVEKVFFQSVDAAIAARRWPAAQAAIRDVQLAKPRWLDTRQADVLMRQIRVAHELRESLDLVLAARLLQDGTVPRAQLLIEYATALHAEGATGDAVLLLREVLRRIPNYALARRLLEEWQKKLQPEPVTPTPTDSVPVPETPAG
jgi:tetratricopeptide (TPR) repeat protein